MVHTRFAPSPTGLLHLGHAYSAVIAHDLARRAGGRFTIRIDDIDGSRSRAEYVEAALDMLRWLGLDWDGEPVVQSARVGDYAAALERLKGERLAYPCFCTRADIAASLSAPHGPTGAVYPGTCRHLSAEERAEHMAHLPHSWRLDMAAAAARVGRLIWQEIGDGSALGAGERLANPLAHGDIILARKDAPSSYHLATSVDDAAIGISHVVRGADLIESTDVHRLLQALLGFPTPLYLHHRLICGPDGKRLAKRNQAAALSLWKDGGHDGKALAEALRQHQLPAGYGLKTA